MLEQEYKIRITEKRTIFAIVKSKDRADAERIIKDGLNFDIAPSDCRFPGDIDVQAERMDEREVLTIEAEK